VVALAALWLRLAGIHNPLLDHPGWRQGDEAAIARNFAQLDFNILHPQTDYDGPPPNYVELELQIVPFAAAALYKVFGIHEVFGRLLSIAFSLATIALLHAFARRLFACRRAAFAAAACFAVFPGAVYYGRTFQPETAMVFFLTAALFFSYRFLTESAEGSWRGFAPAAAALALAFLAKPVAFIALVPLGALSAARFGPGKTLRRPQTYALLGAGILPFLLYDAYVGSIAEWHWASGITRKHVLPELLHSFVSADAFLAKAGALGFAWFALTHTLLGPLGFALAAAGFVALAAPRLRDSAPAAAKTLLWAWLGACALYAYAVVTVERVDYYLLPAAPLAALAGGYALARLHGVLAARSRAAAAAAVLAAVALTGLTGRREIARYYRWSPAVFARAKALDAALAPGALVVMGHYDPSVLYYINRKGWEEDPLLWTPFDEESAIRKGARYFIAVEPKRLARNPELAAWLERFPRLNPGGAWPVYETDPAKVLPGAERRWQEFRRRERGPGASPSG
jgi:hypothetical protein